MFSTTDNVFCEPAAASVQEHLLLLREVYKTFGASE